MANIIISTPTTLTTGINFTAPGNSIALDAYLDANRGLAVSIPNPTIPGVNLTSFGELTAPPNAVLRLRNGTLSSINDATLSTYNSAAPGTGYVLPSLTDTFVVSAAAFPTTQILTYSGGSIVKATNNTTFSYSLDIGSAGNTYTLIGGQGNDTIDGSAVSDNITGGIGNDRLSGGGGADNITGGIGNDRLFGNGDADSLDGGAGNDTLRGGAGSDTLTGGTGNDAFVFTSQGTDTLTDFASADDRFSITSASYAGAPAANTVATLGNAAGAGVANSSSYIIVDTLTNIQGVSASNTRFAYSTNTNVLLYDANGIWSAGNTTIANVTLTGGLTAANFEFI